MDRAPGFEPEGRGFKSCKARFGSTLRKEKNMRKKSFLTKFNLMDHLVALFRYKQALKYLKKNSSVLDIGCGYNAYFLNYVSSLISQGVGLDISVNESKKTNKIRLIRWDLNLKNFPVVEKFDIAVCLAVLEHVLEPKNLLANIFNSLKEEGLLLLTAPTWNSKSYLEFLAFKLRIISPQEIADHKRYFNKPELVSLCSEVGFREVIHSYFQLGFNNFVLASK